MNVLPAELILLLDPRFVMIMDVVRMIDLAVQQFHLDDPPLLLRLPQDLLQPRHAIFYTRLPIHALPVAAETNEVLITGLSDQVDMFRITFYQGSMVFGMVPALGEAYFRAIAHGGKKSMLLQHWPVLGTYQVDGAESDLIYTNT